MHFGADAPALVISFTLVHGPLHQQPRTLAGILLIHEGIFMYMLIHPVSNAYISNYVAPNCAVWVLNHFECRGGIQIVLRLLLDPV